MALTESKMINIGSRAPYFELLDTVSGKQCTYDHIKGSLGTVVLFLCNHCPYVVHVNQELINIANEYLSQGIGFVAISSNDVEHYPDDAPEKMSLVAKVLKFPYPYLFDEDQSVARAYDAACTPDIFVFDQNDTLYYRGRLDESRPGNQKPLDGKDLRLALTLMLRNEPPLINQYPSAGCNIKWK